MPRVLAIVPAYNEATRIAPVVERLVALGLPVLVVDDGSRDGTAAAASAAGARILRQANAGKGAAMRAGCAWAIVQGYDRVVLLDGDGQHDAREAPRLLRAAERADLVIGRRIIDLGRQPLYRRFFNRMSSLIVTVVAGRRIRDSQSGFRVFDPSLLLRLPLKGMRYDLESEICVLAARAGLRIAEVPITVIYNDKRSGVHPLFDTWRFFLAVARGACNSRARLRRFRREEVVCPTAAARGDAPLGLPATAA
jgi:glycosyltransferase involved in cell wall biosynthesis